MGTHAGQTEFAGCLGAGEDSPLALLGLSDDSQSSLHRGCADAPLRVRRAYDGESFNGTTESEVDLRGAIFDAGILVSERSWAETSAKYREVCERLLASGKTLFALGGDHSVTVPVIEALAVLHEPVHVVQIDAHPDLYPSFEGSLTSHACVGARFLEMAHVASLTQLGIRTRNQLQVAFGQDHRARLHQFTASQVASSPPALDHIAPGALVYLTVDADGLDPAFAPGVSHPVPGGVSPRFVLDLIQRASWRLVGMDVVEVNPARDVNDPTSIVAGRLLHEGMGYSRAFPRGRAGPRR